MYYYGSFLQKSKILITRGFQSRELYDLIIFEMNALYISVSGYMIYISIGGCKTRFYKKQIEHK
jgi:hypothetical protein